MKFTAVIELSALILLHFCYPFICQGKKSQKPLTPYLCLIWSLPVSHAFPKLALILCIMKRDTFIQG